MESQYLLNNVSAICEKCNGTGKWQYDDIHITVCDKCCKHDKGWWELTEAHGGYIAGGDNGCCLAGCGMRRRDYLKQLNKQTREAAMVVPTATIVV